MEGPRVKLGGGGGSPPPSPPTYTGLLAAQASARPTAVALRVRGTSISYRALAERAARVAGGLQRRRVGLGDRVAISAPNSLHLFDCILGTIWAGACAALLHTRFGPGDVGPVLDRLTPAVVIVGASAPGRDPAIPAVRDWATERSVLVLDEEFTASCVGNGLAVPSRERPDEPTIILHTSGTSSGPKSVVHTTSSLVPHHLNLIDAQQITDRDRIACPVPMTSVWGVGCLLTETLGSGACLVVDDYEADTFVDWLLDERITVVNALDTMAPLWGDSPPELAVRTGIVGLVRDLESSLIAGLAERWGANVISTYGMTELGIGAAYMRARDPVPIRDRVGGRTAPGVEIRLLDAGGRDVENDEIGDIVVRGRNVFREYLGDPAATDRAFDANGWFRTNDLGRQLGDRLILVGRSGDMVKVSGFNVDPAEVERILEAVPGVSRACAVGVPDERRGEVVAALLVGTPGLEARAVEACRQQLADYKVPQHVYLVDAVPVTVGPHGEKLQRPTARALVLERRSSEAAHRRRAPPADTSES